MVISEFKNGKMTSRDMTAEEIAEIEITAAEMPTPEPTELEQLRADMDFLLMLMEG